MSSHAAEGRHCVLCERSVALGALPAVGCAFCGDEGYLCSDCAEGALDFPGIWNSWLMSYASVHFDCRPSETGRVPRPMDRRSR